MLRIARRLTAILSVAAGLAGSASSLPESDNSAWSTAKGTADRSGGKATHGASTSWSASEMRGSGDSAPGSGDFLLDDPGLPER